MADVPLIKLDAAATDGQVPTADGLGGYTWGTPSGGGGSGSVLQVVTATSSTLETTTSTSYVDSSLSGTITPAAADSLLIVEVHAEMLYSQVASTEDRRGWIAINNSTDATIIKEEIRGRDLVAATSGAASSFFPAALKGIYTVNSTDPRTFVFQHRVVDAKCESQLVGTRTGGALMLIWEIAA